MQIAFYQPEYLETVADLLREMSVHYNGSDASSREQVRRNLVENMLGRHSGVQLVLALEADRAVGLASISILYPARKERGQLFMKELYVVSDHRGRGIGKALMQFVARHALDTGCTRFDWTVDAADHDAAGFYRQLGASALPEKLYFRLAGADLEHFAFRGSGERGGGG